MVYGYIRVSTDKQTVENQRFEIVNFAKREKLGDVQWIEETISGAKDYRKRKLGGLLRRLRSGDLLICTEISRLGRSLFMVIDILNWCLKHKVRVWTIKDGFRLDDDLISKVLAFAFGLSAEIERKLLSQRVKESLARLKSEGRRLGRPLLLLSYASEIRADWGKVNIPALARRYGVSYSTVWRFAHRHLGIPTHVYRRYAFRCVRRRGKRGTA